MKPRSKCTLKIKKSSKCVPRGIKRVFQVCLWSRPVIDKNLAIVGFKKSYYLNIPLQKSSKNPKYSKKTQKYSIFDQILEIFNQNWPFSHWTGNLDIFKSTITWACRGRKCVGVVSKGFSWFKSCKNHSNLFMIEQKSFLIMILNRTAPATESGLLRRTISRCVTN